MTQNFAGAEHQWNLGFGIEGFFHGGSGTTYGLGVPRCLVLLHDLPGTWLSRP